jgi:monoamine oxidase
VFGASDEMYRITRGNSALIEKLTEALEGSIHLQHMLTAISDRSGRYVLSFKDQADVTADYVVITIPFTMLRGVKMDLHAMTDAKRTAIRELGYGQNNKLFLGYNNRPWREGGNKFYGYLFHQDIHDGWDAGAIKTIPSGKGAYCCFIGGNDSIELAKVAVKNPNAPPSHVWKTDLPQSAIDKYVARVDQVFPGSRETYAGRHVFACWSSYPFVKGSYTCPRPGQWNGVLPHVGKPVGKVYFAGEHCSGEFQGFMNGAAETGRVAAEQIVAQIAKPR